MRWNLRLAAAQRDIWKASELQRMLAEAGLVISAGKMSNLWSGQPVTIRLDDLEVICEVLGCEPGDLLIREPGKFRRDQPEHEVTSAAAGGGGPVIRAPARWTLRTACVNAPARRAAGSRRRPRATRLRGCDHCLAWGVLTERLCKACRSFASTHPAGQCATCDRGLPVEGGVCRPCRKQASLIAGPGYKTALELSVADVTGHQLWFHFGRLARAGHRPADALPAAAPPGPVRLRSRWVQLLLFDLPRDLSRVSAQLPPVDAGLAELLEAEAGRLAELRGWSPRTLSLTQRGLRILMAVHGPGEPVRASTVRQLTARNMPFPHITATLAAAGALEDDRPDTLAVWLDEQLAGLPAQIHAELDTWLGLLRHGGPRRRPRSRRTIVRDIYSIRTFLTGIGGRYSTLRQVTRDDITGWLASRPGRSRPQDASTLRSLFGTLKAEQLIFANPTRGIRVPRRNPTVPTPLPPQLITATAAAARGDPALRAVVALAGVHALLPGQIRHLHIDQIDLASRRLDPGGLDRPLDEFTASAIRGYLDFRDQRWPATTSPCLLVTRKTAHTGDPVSQFWMNRLFRGLPVTAEQLRDDRIVEEALAGRADPLHLAAVFGFGPRTGLRYAQAARHAGEPADTLPSQAPPDP